MTTQMLRELAEWTVTPGLAWLVETPSFLHGKSETLFSWEFHLGTYVITAFKMIDGQIRAFEHTAENPVVFAGELSRFPNGRITGAVAPRVPETQAVRPAKRPCDENDAEGRAKRARKDWFLAPTAIAPKRHADPVDPTDPSKPPKRARTAFAAAVERANKRKPGEPQAPGEDSTKRARVW